MSNRFPREAKESLQMGDSWRRRESNPRNISPVAQTRLGQVRESHSPATQPGYRTGCKPGNAGRRWPQETLTGDEVAVLLAGCSRTSNIGNRNRAIIATLYRSGLRCSELLDLYPKDVDLDQGAIRVLHGKGDKTRIVGIDPGTADYVQNWTGRRATLGIDGTYPLFCTLHGTRLHGAYLRALLHRLANDAGIEKRVTPHSLRHTHAFELANERTALHVIQRQLGHSSIATTSRYIDHLNPTVVVETMNAREW